MRMDPRKASASRAASAAVLLSGEAAAWPGPRDRMLGLAGAGQGPRLRVASAAAAFSYASSAKGMARS